MKLEASNAVPTTIILLIRAAILMFLELCSKKFKTDSPHLLQSVDIAPVSAEVCSEAVDSNDGEFNLCDFRK